MEPIESKSEPLEYASPTTPRPRRRANQVIALYRLLVYISISLLAGTSVLTNFIFGHARHWEMPVGSLIFLLALWRAAAAWRTLFESI